MSIARILRWNFVSFLCNKRWHLFFFAVRSRGFLCNKKGTSCYAKISTIGKKILEEGNVVIIITIFFSKLRQWSLDTSLRTCNCSVCLTRLWILRWKKQVTTKETWADIAVVDKFDRLSCNICDLPLEAMLHFVRLPPVADVFSTSPVNREWNTNEWNFNKNWR
jgi:hypothetical protein